MTYKTEDRHRISDYWINTYPDKITEYWVREGANNILYTSEGGKISFRQCTSGTLKGKLFCRKNDISSELEKGAIPFMLRAYFWGFLEDDLFNIDNEENFGICMENKYLTPYDNTLRILKECNIKDRYFKKFAGWTVTEKGHLVYEPVIYCICNDELNSNNWVEHFETKLWFSNNVKKNFAKAIEYAKTLSHKNNRYE